jgi:hypothetical protein
MEGSAHWIQFIQCARLKPNREAFNETVNSVAGIPFSCRRLIKAEMSKPLDVGIACEPCVGRVYARVLERETSWNADQQALAVPQRKSLRASLKIPAIDGDLYDQ